MADSNKNKKEPLIEIWLQGLKNHPAVAALLLLAAVVTGLASFAESVDKLRKFLMREPEKVGAVKKSEQDLGLEKAIIGTWLSSSKLPVPTGIVVNDFRYTFLSNGIVNWRGSYTVQGHEFPIMMSGKWNIADGVLQYKVESSNVPLAVKEGFSSFTKIVKIDNDKMTYVDSADGKTKVDMRVE
jgi:hypothetical protein